MDADLLARFGAALAGHDARMHEVGDLDGARARARELAGGDTVARWGDEALDGIAATEALPAEAKVSLVLAELGIAETGQIALVHRTGRSRAAGLLPERQIALLAADAIVEDLDLALARVFADPARPPRNLVLVAGPSRTSDIEQRSIRGVHAPRELDVIVFNT